MSRMLPERLRRIDPRLVDVLPAIVFCAIGQFSIWAGYTTEGPRGLTVPAALVVTIALAWRRRAPVAVAVAVMAVWIAQSIAADPPAAMWEFIVLLLVGYSTGAYADGAAAIAGGLIVVAGLAVVTAFDPAADASPFTPLGLGGAPWLAGRLVRRYSTQARELDVINAELERRRADDVRAATRHERARIARELHDVVAHSISVMVVQAGAAEAMIAGSPAEAEEALSSIRRTGKGALAEMRRLVGVLRADSGGPELGPQPGLDDLAALVDQMRAAGLDARLRFEGERVALQPGPELAAYRVVQEALTNALKHGGRTQAEVTVRFDDAHVELEVVDEGGRSPSPSQSINGSGHGLIGMRERMALYGGSVHAGPREGRGWAVRARLPRDASAP